MGEDHLKPVPALYSSDAGAASKHVAGLNPNLVPLLGPTPTMSQPRFEADWFKEGVQISQVPALSQARF